MNESKEKREEPEPEENGDLCFWEDVKKLLEEKDKQLHATIKSIDVGYKLTIYLQEQRHQKQLTELRQSSVSKEQITKTCMDYECNHIGEDCNCCDGAMGVLRKVLALSHPEEKQNDK